MYVSDYWVEKLVYHSLSIQVIDPLTDPHLDSHILDSAFRHRGVQEFVTKLALNMYVESETVE